MRGITMLGMCGAAIAASLFVKVGAAEEEPFTPILEAKLPEGFPGTTPVGAIEVKHYPEYRKATSSGRSAFWTLFRHIQRNGISMTAPVELTYAGDDAQQPREQSMAFLYGSRALGEPGQAGSVDVVDVPAATVVSIGVRGPRTEESFLDAYDQLQAWLQERESQYAVAGPPRVMAYNSPFVPRNRQFFEVQIPIEARGDSP